MNRDDLARHFYVHEHDEDGATPHDRDRWEAAWDAGKVHADDRAAAYAAADLELAQEATR